MGADRWGRSSETCHDRGREVPLSYDAVLLGIGTWAQGGVGGGMGPLRAAK